MHVYIKQFYWMVFLWIDEWDVSLQASD